MFSHDMDIPCEHRPSRASNDYGHEDHGARPLPVFRLRGLLAVPICRLLLGQPKLAS